MKKILVLFGILVALFSINALLRKNQVSAENPADHARGEILVKFADGVSPNQTAQIHKRLGGRVKEIIPGINVQVVKVDQEIGRAVSAYARLGQVDYAEPNFITHALVIPDDVYFDKQWGMHNTGQTGGTVDADIDGSEAWDLSSGLEIRIAILDTGIDQDHEDLAAKIGLQENFTDSSTVDDLYGHGTHVAGIAAAITGNGIGVAGVASESSLMNVKVLGDDASGYYSWVANGIIWAADNGAKVINMSLGASRKSSALEDAVNYAWSEGSVLVAAAGNSGNPSRTYPAYYQNCIAVAATDDNDQKASWSSYGNWVDVAAPGVEIYSTFPNHDYIIGKSLNYDYGSGTSMSSPHVAGIAALVWTTDSGTSNQAVRDRIQQGADPISGTGDYWIWGRVNACNSVGGSCSEQAPAPTPTPTPTPEPTEEPTPTPEPDECSLYCFKGVCDGHCHPVREDSSCPDCW